MKLQEMLSIKVLSESAKVEYIASSIGPKVLKAAQDDISASNMLDPHDPSTSVINVLNKIATADPTKAADSLVWLSRMYANKQFRLEDISRIRDDLTKFFKMRKAIPNKDLNSYKSLGQLYDAVEQAEAQNAPTQSKRAATQEIKSEGAKYLINTPKFKALQIITHDAACRYGANTKWCTASREDPSPFNSYSEQGPLFVILATADDGRVHKFQFHVESSQFMDERDQPLSAENINFLSSFPEYEQFLNILIKKSYFPNDE